MGLLMTLTSEHPGSSKILNIHSSLPLMTQTAGCPLWSFLPPGRPHPPWLGLAAALQAVLGQEPGVGWGSQGRT